MITVTNTLSGMYFSASIPSVVFAINGVKASVVMTVDEEIVYSEYLYPVKSIIKVSDLSNLITPYAKQKLKIAFSIAITEEYDDATPPNSVRINADVIYCEVDYGTTASDFIAYHFLSILLGKKTTAIGRLEYLHFIGTDAAMATASYSDNSTESFPLIPVGGNDKYTTIEVSSSLFVKSNKTLIGYVVIAGNRRQQYVIDFSNPDCAPILIFDNSFGVEELLYCTGTATLSPTFKRDVAYIEGMQRNYNIEETKTFKADTGILTFAEADWASELFRSKYIRVVNFVDGQPNIGREVMITESKNEYTNNYSELPRITFSYQYAQRNHNVIDLNRIGRIFDNTFDNTFD